MISDQVGAGVILKDKYLIENTSKHLRCQGS